MNRGLKDNPLERMKVLEFPGTDFNLMGAERVFYETKELIQDIEIADTDPPVTDNRASTNSTIYDDISLGDKLKKLFSHSG